MADPLGLIANIGASGRLVPLRPLGEPAARGPGFREVLTDQIEKVNRLLAEHYGEETVRRWYGGEKLDDLVKKPFATVDEEYLRMLDGLVLPAEGHIADRRQAVAERLQISSLLRRKLRLQANRMAAGHAADRQGPNQHQKRRTHYKRLHCTPHFSLGALSQKCFEILIKQSLPFSIVLIRCT